jgi:hypothetical protein
MLIGRQLEVVGHERPVEVGEGTNALVEDNAETCAQSVAVHDKDLVEVGHL